eukprot:1219624-Amphidinium_carterae.2
MKAVSLDAINQVRTETQRVVEEMRRKHQAEEASMRSVVEAELMDQVRKRDQDTLKSIQARDGHWSSTVQGLKKDRVKIQEELISKIHSAEDHIQKLKVQIQKEGQSPSPFRSEKDHSRSWKIPEVASFAPAPRDLTRGRTIEAASLRLEPLQMPCSEGLSSKVMPQSPNRHSRGSVRHATEAYRP